MKTLGFILLSSAITTPALSSDFSNFDGFYVGASAGATQTQIKLKRQIDINYLFGMFEEEYHSFTSTSIYREIPFGEIKVGYGHTIGISPLFLGVNLFGNLARRKIFAKPGNTFVEQPGFIGSGTVGQATKTAIRLNTFEYGIDFTPGVLLSPFSLVYTRIGAAFNKIRFNTKGSFSIEDINIGGTAVTDLNVTSKKNVTGLRLGLGMVQKLSPHWGLTGDYIYTDYGHISTNATVNVNNIGFTPTLNGYTSQVKTQLSTQTITLGANYYFDPCPSNSPIYAPEEALEFFNSFYVGIEGGALQNQIDRKINYVAHFQLSAIPQHTIGLSKSAHHFSNSGVGTVYLGYGQLLNGSLFYLSADIFDDLANHDITSKNINIANLAVPPSSNRDTLAAHTTTSLDSFEYGGDIKPGILITPQTLIYGRIGVAFNTLKINSSSIFTFDNLFAPTAPPTLVSTLNVNTDKNVRGLRLGFGIEESLNKCFSADFDYIYTNYGKISLNATGDVVSVGVNPETGEPLVVTTPNGLVTHVDGKVSSEEELLGLSYHF